MRSISVPVIVAVPTTRSPFFTLNLETMPFIGANTEVFRTLSRDSFTDASVLFTTNLDASSDCSAEARLFLATSKFCLAICQSDSEMTFWSHNVSLRLKSASARMKVALEPDSDAWDETVFAFVWLREAS